MADVRPWFALHVFAFESSLKVRAMTFEAEGVYNALLRSQWANGYVPASDEGLRTCLIKPVSQAALEQVKPCFPVDNGDPSIRLNPRLKRERSQASSKREEAVKRGRKGGVISGLNRRRVASSKREEDPEPPLQEAPKSHFNLAPPVPQLPEQLALVEEPGKALVAPPKRDLATQAKTANRKLKEAALSLAARTVFSYWRDQMGFDPEGTILNDQRATRIIARLRENGGDVSELLYVVDGALKNDWTMGRDPKSTKPYNGTQHVFRDREQVESLLSLVRRREPVHPYLREHPDA